MLYLVVEVVHVLSILTSRGHLSRGSVIIGQASKRDQGGRKKRPSIHQREAPKVLFSLVFTLSLSSLPIAVVAPVVLPAVFSSILSDDISLLFSLSLSAVPSFFTQ